MLYCEQPINDYRYYRGRGAFESMGAGLPMAPGDIAFKSNFATRGVCHSGVQQAMTAARSSNPY
jgi:2,3-bisphosphoglycerate-independent phosphoglycerate mutase